MLERMGYSNLVCRPVAPSGCPPDPPHSVGISPYPLASLKLLQSRREEEQEEAGEVRPVAGRFPATDKATALRGHQDMTIQI